MNPTADEIEALARKYRTLADLRRARAAGGDVAPRDVLGALAREFPGALRELDTRPLDDIDRRLAALERTLGGEPVEPWMAWTVRYHALLRAALGIKRRASRWHVVDDPDAEAARASREAGMDVDVDFVRAVLHPPEGRVNGVVFARLDALFGTRPGGVREAIAPPRLPRRALRGP